MAIMDMLVEGVLLGIALSMDAFSISLANGLSDPAMRVRRRLLIAGTFAFFQFLMPMIGWFCVRTVAQQFSAFQRAIPWIAFILLCGIGGKMLLEGIKGSVPEEADAQLSYAMLLLQGIATSIDALSVGFALASLSSPEALVTALVIAIVTLFVCLGGLAIGRAFGTKLAGRASILGGCILIFVGIRIFFSAF